MRIVAIAMLALAGCGGLVTEDGAGGSNGLGAAPDEDAATPTSPPRTDGDGGACVAPSGPPFVTPREPTMTKAEACAAGGAEQSTFASEDEVWSLIVGSFRTCSGGGTILSHPGFVIGGDRTLRFVERDTAGVEHESDVMGRVKVIAVGGGGAYQINFEQPGGTNIVRVTKVGVGDRLLVDGEGGRGSVARVAPGSAARPAGYRDSGTCSLAGTWDAQAGVRPSDAKSSGIFYFDGKGLFLGAERDGDLCHAPTMKGTYQLVGDVFEIVTSEGMGCPSTYAAGWSVKFSPTCREAYLTMTYDNCTGGRHSIEYDTKLTKP